MNCNFLIIPCIIFYNIIHIPSKMYKNFTINKNIIRSAYALSASLVLGNNANNNKTTIRIENETPSQTYAIGNTEEINK